MLSRPVINESETPTDTSIQYANHRSSYLRKSPEGPDKERKLRLLLGNLERQTSLGCTIERRNLDVWALEESPPTTSPQSE